MLFRVARGMVLLIIGRRRAGKTALVWALLQGHRSVVIFDNKHDPDEWIAWARRNGGVVTSNPLDIRRYPVVVYQVTTEELDDRPGWRRPGSVGYRWTLALQLVMERGNTVVVFNEALRMLPSAGGANPQARRLLEQGAGPGITVIVETQLLEWVDTHVLKMAEWVGIFGPVRQPDLEKLELEREADVSPLRSLKAFDRHYGLHELGTLIWRICTPAPFPSWAKKKDFRSMKSQALPAPAEIENEPQHGTAPALNPEPEGAQSPPRLEHQGQRP